MKLVRESIKFKRHTDPLKGLGLGKDAYLRQKGDSIGWEWHHDEQRGEPLEYLEYRGVPIKLIKSSYYPGYGDQFYANIATGIPARSIDWVSPSDYAIELAKKKIDRILDNE